jgi:hypothetical protein
METALSHIDRDRSPVVDSRGTGWLAFAATLMLLSGVFKIFDAFWAFKYDSELSETVETVVLEGNLAAWGWVWLVVGVVLVAAGVAVARGAEWARWVGIVVAGITVALAVTWIFFQPLWAILTVTLGILVIFALAVYGGRDPVGTDYE